MKKTLISDKEEIEKIIDNLTSSNNNDDKKMKKQQVENLNFNVPYEGGNQ